MSVKYLSLCKHTDVGGGIGGIIVLAISEDGAVEEGQVVTSRVVQLHLGVNEGKHIQAFSVRH